MELSDLSIQLLYFFLVAFNLVIYVNWIVLKDTLAAPIVCHGSFKLLLSFLLSMSNSLCDRTVLAAVLFMHNYNTIRRGREGWNVVVEIRRLRRR